MLVEAGTDDVGVVSISGSSTLSAHAPTANRRASTIAAPVDREIRIRQIRIDSPHSEVGQVGALWTS